MARDRKRAKQRRQRHPGAAQPVRTRAAETEGDGEGIPRYTPTPDPLDHASADVDEARLAEAGLAEGTNFEADELPEAELAEEEAERGHRGRPLTARDDHEVERRRGNRVFAFLRACWAELQRVQWPDRRQVAQATGVVLGFVVVAGLYLGLLDALFSRVVNAIL